MRAVQRTVCYARCGACARTLTRMACVADESARVHYDVWPSHGRRRHLWRGESVTEGLIPLWCGSGAHILGGRMGSSCGMCK